MSEKTIFEKIIAGEILCEKIYEDNDTFAFLDIAPNNFGHSLVIPKNPHKNLYEMPDNELQNLIVSVKKVAIAIKKGLEATGINIAMNNDSDAGQEVFHAHIHVIPRFPNDGFKHGRHLKYSEGQEKEIGDKIRKFL